jgi:stage III sporulation protein SpoIIIAA
MFFVAVLFSILWCSAWAYLVSPSPAHHSAARRLVVPSSRVPPGPNVVQSLKPASAASVGNSIQSSEDYAFVDSFYRNLHDYIAEKHPISGLRAGINNIDKLLNLTPAEAVLVHRLKVWKKATILEQGRAFGLQYISTNNTDGSFNMILAKKPAPRISRPSPKLVNQGLEQNNNVAPKATAATFSPANRYRASPKSAGVLSILSATDPIGSEKFLTFHGEECTPVMSDLPGVPLVIDCDGEAEQAGAGLTMSDRVDLDLLVGLLSREVSQTILSSPRYGEITEIVMDLHRPPVVWYSSITAKDISSKVDSSREELLQCSVVSQSDLKGILQNSKLGRFHHANRACIASTIHRVSRRLNLNRDVIGLTLRVGRTAPRAGDVLSDILRSGRSILLLGAPGSGKTTLLRHAARILAERNRVEVIDTTNEIAGDSDVPHKSIGRARRMMVSPDSSTHQVMIEAVQNHTPEFVIVDEIRSRREVDAAADIARRGVGIVATAHGKVLQDLLQNPELCGLLGGIQTVILGDDEAKARQEKKKHNNESNDEKVKAKVVQERKAMPVFDVLIEIRDRDHYAIHHNLATAVSDTLLSKNIVVEERRRDKNGTIKIKNVERMCR